MSRYDPYLHRKHNKTLLLAHVIFVTKYREELSAKGIWDRIKHEMYRACSEIAVTVLEMETDKDHIHLLIQYPPMVSISKIAKHLKQVSTYRLWKSYGNYLKKVYWHEHTLWSDGYFACSIGNASEDTIREYIKNQG